jgi:hypothetical protein
MNVPQKWMRLKETNDWGNITTTLNGKPFERKAGSIDVMFPDGTVATCKLKYAGVSEHVSDHGHESTVHSTVPVIEFDYHGLKIEERLSRAGLKIDAANL